MTTTEETPRAVCHYRWAVTFQCPGYDPAEISGVMTSVGTPEEDAGALKVTAERWFRQAHPDQDGPVTVLSLTVEPDGPEQEPRP